MPTEQELEYEISLARNDLESNLTDLEHVLKDKLDLGKQAGVALDLVKEKVHEVVERKAFQTRLFLAEKRDQTVALVRNARREANLLYTKTRAKVEERPVAAAAIVVGALATVIGGIAAYRRLARG